MKKHTSIFLILLFFLATSCEDFSLSAPITIKKADTSFLAEGGSGKIEIDRNKGVTVNCQQEWCKVSISGSTIDLSIEENKDVAGRSASIEISNKESKKIVTISQLGYISDIDIQSTECSLKGETFTYKIQSIIDLEFKLEPEGEASDWLSYSFDKEKGELTITAEASDGKKNRKAEFVVKRKGVVWKTATFSQRRTISGKYTLRYTDHFAQKEQTATCTIVQDEENEGLFLLTFYKQGKFSHSTPVSAIFFDNHLHIPNIQFLDVVDPTTQVSLLLIFFDRKNGKYSSDDKLTLVAKREDDDAADKIIFRFKDSGSGLFNMMAFAQFTVDKITGIYWGVANPVLESADDE